MATRFKAHRYTDGSIRIEMPVVHQLNAFAITAVLCSKHRSDDTDDLPTLTYSQVIKTLRTELRERGLEHAYYWRDEFDDEESDEADALLHWAQGEVSRLFPELGPPIAH
ncbi:hypothetical protein ACFYZ8_33490 [Streptomyces sp. NPDC001668]|uniref:hypothetical protein n=1 Tax=Streptomyces sp. NPDC001668 TaxID=3364598 RepID=UPI003693C1CE